MKNNFQPVIRTRDIDFLLHRPPKLLPKIDLEKLFSDLGFEVEHAANGSMRLENAELILELLIPEIGAGSNKPYSLPELKLNAQALRHLSMLWRNPITVEVAKIKLHLPHPADFCLHKMIIYKRRQSKDKKELGHN